MWVLTITHPHPNMKVEGQIAHDICLCKTSAPNSKPFDSVSAVLQFPKSSATAGLFRDKDCHIQRISIVHWFRLTPSPRGPPFIMLPRIDLGGPIPFKDVLRS